MMAKKAGKVGQLGGTGSATNYRSKEGAGKPMPKGKAIPPAVAGDLQNQNYPKRKGNK